MRILFLHIITVCNIPVHTVLAKSLETCPLLEGTNLTILINFFLILNPNCFISILEESINPERRLEGTIRMSQRLRIQETVHQISVDFRISKKRLSQLEDAYEQRRSLENKPRSGRPRKATTQMAGCVIRALQNDPILESEEVRDSVNRGLRPSK